MDSPTTVRGWLETLPELPTVPKVYLDGWLLDKMDRLAESLADAIAYSNYRLKHVFWHGFEDYLRGNEPRWPANQWCNLGYNAAKAAYEALPTPETLENHKVAYVAESLKTVNWQKCIKCCRDFVVDLRFTTIYTCSECMEAKPFDYSKFVGECVQISPDRLAELESKAAKWDTIAPKIQYLSDIFEDLKKMKP